MQRYDDLKALQPRELDPLVYLLSKMVDDKPLCDFLRERRPALKGKPRVQASSLEQVVPVGVAVPDLPPQGAKLTPLQVQALKGQLSTLTMSMEEVDKKRKLKIETSAGDFPQLPPWLFQRAYLTSDYISVAADITPQFTLGSLPLLAQQTAVMDDLLNLMLGVDGRFISAKPLKEGQKRAFSLDHTLDVSLLSLVKRILPICTHYSSVSRFVEEQTKFTHGMVNQGLAAAMRALLREHTVVVAQLENQLLENKLTLQKMWYYIQPCLKTMELLARAASIVEKGQCRGGKTLTVLHKFTASLMGDDRAHELGLYLTQAACKPFLEMLSLWLFDGKVADPYLEFMITENTEIKRDRLHEEYNDYYWKRRYTVCQENVPIFLELLAERILDTGKYLNVVRSCGQEVEGMDEDGPLEYTLQERVVVDRIKQAYSRASHKLLGLVMKEHDLLGHLRSIKHFFLLDQGDLMVHFMDTAEEELNNPIGSIPVPRLEALLELALRTSISNSDPYKDNLHLLLIPFNLKLHLIHVLAVQPEKHGIAPPVTRPPSSTSLPGYEALCLDYHVQWPLSLILSRMHLTHYQLVFRHLFLCKYVERQLAGAWKCHKNTLRGPDRTHTA